LIRIPVSNSLVPIIREERINQRNGGHPFANLDLTHLKKRNPLKPYIRR
jgi:hypothetical protein